MYACLCCASGVYVPSKIMGFFNSTLSVAVMLSGEKLPTVGKISKAVE